MKELRVIASDEAIGLILGQVYNVAQEIHIRSLDEVEPSAQAIAKTISNRQSATAPVNREIMAPPKRKSGRGGKRTQRGEASGEKAVLDYLQSQGKATNADLSRHGASLGYAPNSLGARASGMVKKGTIARSGGVYYLKMPPTLNGAH